METREFNNWLTANNYAEITIKSYCRTITKTPSIKRYEDLINHIGSLQGKVKAETINQRLVSLRLYFEYLKERGEVTRNLAKKVKVRNIEKPLLKLIKRKELDEMYLNFEGSLKDKILLGLLVYQGADLGTTKNLDTSHFNLEKGEVYLPGTKRINSRRLSLHGCQLLPLYRYLENRKEDEKLFTSSLRNDYDKLIKHLRKTEKKAETIRQIRGSVITNWLSQYNLREVQYYCGHKHIGSTEKYKRVDLESMKSDLKKYHLFG